MFECLLYLFLSSMIACSLSHYKMWFPHLLDSHTTMHCLQNTHCRVEHCCRRHHRYCCFAGGVLVAVSSYLDISEQLPDCSGLCLQANAVGLRIYTVRCIVYQLPKRFLLFFNYSRHHVSHGPLVFQYGPTWWQTLRDTEPILTG